MDKIIWTKERLDKKVNTPCFVLSDNDQVDIINTAIALTVKVERLEKGVRELIRLDTELSYSQRKHELIGQEITALAELEVE